MKDPHYTYILASKPRGALYVGTSTDLVNDIDAHRRNLIAGLTSLYPIHQLVYFERHRNPVVATDRETVLKLWHRQWKLELIEQHNPEWRDLYPEIAGQQCESLLESI